MKNIFICLLFAILIISTLLFIKSYFPVTKSPARHATITQKPSKTSSMKITSTAFNDNENIPVKYSCKGDNINPPLQFSDIPQNTKSLALTMDDPDAPIGTFVHWVIYNIDPSVTGIEENTKPQGTEGKNGAGQESYYGPCPPSGTHHYHFKLYALDSLLKFDQAPDKKALEDKMQGHILEQAELVGLFSK